MPNTPATACLVAISLLAGCSSPEPTANGDGETKSCSPDQYWNDAPSGQEPAPRWSKGDYWNFTGPGYTNGSIKWLNLSVEGARSVPGVSPCAYILQRTYGTTDGLVARADGGWPDQYDVTTMGLVWNDAGPDCPEPACVGSAVYPLDFPLSDGKMWTFTAPHDDVASTYNLSAHVVGDGVWRIDYQRFGEVAVQWELNYSRNVGMWDFGVNMTLHEFSYAAGDDSRRN